MTERPMIFTGHSVRQILADLKTQTRRAVKRTKHFAERNVEPSDAYDALVADVPCPYGKPGDRLWVKETWRPVERETDSVDGILYRADDAFIPIENSFEAAERWVDAYDNGKYGTAWRSPLYMKRWMSRVVLEIASVRVERVQEISEDDARAEGCPAHAHFATLWDSINGKREGCAWEDDPWCWCLEFRRVAPRRSAS